MIVIDNRSRAERRVGVRSRRPSVSLSVMSFPRLRLGAGQCRPGDPSPAQVPFPRRSGPGRVRSRGRVRDVAGARAGSRVPSLAITLGMVRLVRDGWPTAWGLVCTVGRRWWRRSPGRGSRRRAFREVDFKNLPLCKPCWRNSGARMWRCIRTCPGSTRALEIALVHGSAPPRYRAARVVLGTGEVFGPLNPTIGCCPISMA